MVKKIYKLFKKKEYWKFLDNILVVIKKKNFPNFVNGTFCSTNILYIFEEGVA
jgi:hypothetical protein